MRKTTFLKTLLLFISCFVLTNSVYGETTFFSFTGTSGYVAPPAANWTSSGTVDGGSYLKLCSGYVVSPVIEASTGLVFKYDVATFGSGVAGSKTILYVLNAVDNSIISQFTLTSANSSTYVANQSQAIGSVAVGFKIKIEGVGDGLTTNSANKGTRLRNFSLLGTSSPACTASNLAFAQPVVNKLVADAAFTQTASSLNATTAITYESSNTGVVNVNAATGEVSIVGTGSATITASQAAGSHNSVEYCAATASYTVNVVSAAPTITVTEVTVPDMVAYAGETDTETMNVSGINLTEDIRLEISGVNADQFSLSKNSVAQVGGTAANTVITVIYQPTSAGAHTAVLSVLSAGATTVTRTLNGSATWKPLAKPVLTGATSVSANALTLNWDAVSGATEYEVNVFTKTTGSASLASDLFISEYIEGSGYNKAIEIYNGTGAAVDLSNYSLFKQTNGAGAYGNELALSGTLLNADVFVVAYVSGSNAASTGILAVTDLQTASSAVNFNGNDAVGLFKNGVQIDEVGIFNQETPSWGTDLTLIRKSSANVPKAIYDAADWDVMSKDYITNLGTHTFAPTGGSTSTPIPGSPFTVATNSKDLTGLVTSTTYYYTVKAKNANVVSELSDEMSVATLGTAVPELNAGLNLRVVGGSIVFDAVADQLVEVYNAVGQRIKSTITVDGLNTVAVGNKGVVLVKVGAQIQKVIL